MHWVLGAVLGPSLVVAGGTTLATPRFLTAGARLAAERRLQGTQAPHISTQAQQPQRAATETWDLPDPGTCVPCTGRQIPTYPVAWEVPLPPL